MTQNQSMQSILHFADHILDQGYGHVVIFDVDEVALSLNNPEGIRFNLSLQGPQESPLLVFRNARTTPSIPNGHFAVRRFGYNPSTRKTRYASTLRSYGSVDTLLKDFFVEVDQTTVPARLFVYPV